MCQPANVKMDKPSSGGALQMLFTFTVWYAFNAGYNVYNSYVKSYVQLPFFVAAMQLAVGMFYAIPSWILGIRKTPKLSSADFARLIPIAMFNMVGHVLSVCAMFQKGGGSFTHVIKASEPVVSVILALLINGVVPNPVTALTLLPITYGVAYASTLGNLDAAVMAKELTSPVAIMAMGGNIMFGIRSILKKKLPSDFKERTRMDASNEHAVTTLLSLILALPVLCLFESPDAIMKDINSIEDKNGFLFNLFVCGMCFYLYNDMQNIVLSSLGPVPTAVGNTLKRVVIFVALFFCVPGETFPFPKIVGCGIAVAGCLAFAVADSMKI